MKNRLFTSVLLIILLFASLAVYSKDSKRVILEPKKCMFDGYTAPVEKNAPSTFNSALTIDKFWLDHTDGGSEYYLGSGAASDTFAVWFEGAGACSIHTIHTSWYDADGNNSLLFYVWDVSADAPYPGFSVGRGEFDSTKTVLGDVIAGPIPITPTGYGWNSFDLKDYVAEIPFFGEIDGTPAPFFVGYVKLGEIPHPLADGSAGTKGYNYTWFCGPWTDGKWGGYHSIIELMMKLEVSYPFGAKPIITDILNLSSTYDGNRDITVTANIVDDETVAGAWLLWAVNGNVPTDSLAMTEGANNIYTAVFNPAASLGDEVHYWVSAKDNLGGYSRETPNVITFTVVAPENPDAQVLLVDDGSAYQFDYTRFYEEVLDSLHITYEYWDAGANNGIDYTVTTAGWTVALVDGWGASTMTTREYDANQAWAAFLTSGHGLLYIDQDYFFGNGEGDVPVFVAGDFAYDFFGIASGINDPATTDTLIIGVADDPITGFASAEAVPFRPGDWGLSNYMDYITARTEADDIWSGDDTYNDCGIKYDGGTFKTVHAPFLAQALNDTTGYTDSTMVYSEAFFNFIKNSMIWFGIEVGIKEVNNDLIPEEFSLSQNYPNPFNPVTNITYNISKAVDVNITVYSITGEKVATLVNGKRPAGSYTITWDGLNNANSKIASGIYFYTINAGDFTATKKMVLLK